jgi:DNA-binding CsgD family transcriptional regulator
MAAAAQIRSLCGVIEDHPTGAVQLGRLGIDGAGWCWWAGGVEGLAPLVGRERELARMRGGLAGDARLLLVVGDAGVGKTRLVGEGVQRAAAAGGLVSLWGGCLPLAEKLPLLPVAQALGELSGLEGGRLLEAALAVVPGYVRVELGRLLPWLGPGVPDEAGWGGGWQRERLFSGVAELLAAVAGRSPVGLVVEDVHWADSATLDCLTFLARAGGKGQLTVVATCRSDEAPVDAHVAAWLAHVRGGGGAEEIRLGPLSRGEVAEQVAALVGGPVPGRLADEVYVRGEGNPFFTEQLVAAALTDSVGGGLSVLTGLPARLAEFLVARAARCDGDARAVLAALAVAGRPLTEGLLSEITGLELEVVRRGLRELATARLLAESISGGAHRPRHALLGEAVAGGLLPGERAALHEGAARALQAADGERLAAEVAEHWEAAGRPAEELPAQVTAAAAAERVFAYAEAAAHRLRAIELCQALPGTADAAGINLLRLYVQAIDALDLSGASERAGEVAEEAYQRFAGHLDRATAAAIHQRAAIFRGMDAPAAGLPLIKEALRLFGQAPPSAEHAEAWFVYATMFLFHGEGRREASLTALNHALEIAEASGATDLIPRITSWQGIHAFLRGQIEDGFAILRRGQALAEAAGDGKGALLLAVSESDALLKTGDFQSATEVALRGLQAARQTGHEAWSITGILIFNASEGLLSRGRTAEAAALIDPLTADQADHDHWAAHECRTEIDLLRGDIDTAAERQQQIKALLGHLGHLDRAGEVAQQAAELALWAGRPDDAFREAWRALALYTAPDLTMFCGRLLGAGIRACADLAEHARARQDDHAAEAAQAAAGDLAGWVERMGGVPFADHPFVATIPAERATWDAERTRLAGESDPAAWGAAAKTWDGLGSPHRAGYAWWRQAQAQLDTGQAAGVAAVALRAAAAAAEGHAPLLAQIRALAQRARIALHVPPATPESQPSSAAVPTPYGLTSRELSVLHLLAAGRTNAQIGAELYISPKTASVHVTSILRKLGVSGRVQAAALAERAGLLRPPQP